MLFKRKDILIENLGKGLGYLLAYLLFTTILFFVFTSTNKIPDSWSYVNILGITFLIALFGYVIKWFLK